MLCVNHINLLGISLAAMLIILQLLFTIAKYSLITNLYPYYKTKLPWYTNQFAYV